MSDDTIPAVPDLVILPPPPALVMTPEMQARLNDLLAAALAQLNAAVLAFTPTLPGAKAVVDPTPTIAAGGTGVLPGVLPGGGQIGPVFLMPKGGIGTIFEGPPHGGFAVPTGWAVDLLPAVAVPGAALAPPLVVHTYGDTSLAGGATPLGDGAWISFVEPPEIGGAR